MQKIKLHTEKGTTEGKARKIPSATKRRVRVKLQRGGPCLSRLLERDLRDAMTASGRGLLPTIGAAIPFAAAA